MKHRNFRKNKWRNLIFSVTKKKQKQKRQKRYCEKRLIPTYKVTHKILRKKRMLRYRTRDKCEFLELGTRGEDFFKYWANYSYRQK